ncbi:uncharacterized protein B0I36DRAFT_360902 [Microdochium trichocladiopsis]|uniref:Zn(2)-C6 fungal-type domain-containing protein n=1 Tax=Microdochium trichocladiopsis TaxID=1682393 RepID=A0A9P8YC46_9PEZI|nr:uncharacterized protein B0I36DRAFT_360902 [Microdochium trichocladiopsis]KAH7035557.1 hypothetical protein B0I36DRAFT_360902 [Microdochium trichocladiopsis]
MDALLELGLPGDARGRNNIACHSVDDLQSHFDGKIRAKCSEWRAEHVSVTREFQYHAMFNLSANADDATHDPVMLLQNDGATRRVTAAEAIEKQPSDDPELQKAIAKHIIGRIGAVDGTSWVAREVGRASQGWTFTYICKESLQAWTRATSKTPSKFAIGEWSGPGGLDSVNAVRPAFDCRGTLSIAFSKASRAIVVKYEHTPLHKTVAQLMDLLAPATIPPVSAKTGAANAHRTPKAKRPPLAEGVESTQKKRKRPAPSAGEEGLEGEEPPARKKKPRKSKVKPLDSQATSEATPASQAAAATQDAHAGPAAITTTTAPATAMAMATTSPPAPSFTPLNVPPAEAERRREAAIRLLAGKGINPSTLSNEQLNIFANQAPSLQETSLEMFAMYGAERLRIVHPNDAADNNSASPAPAGAAPIPAANIDPSLSGPQAAPEDGGSTKVSIGDGAVVDVEENGVVGTTTSTLKPSGIRMTRGACDNCKRRKVKCTEERPECSNCVLTPGEQCFYAPAKPRRKSEKTLAEAHSDQEAEMEPDQAANGSSVGANAHATGLNSHDQQHNNMTAVPQPQAAMDRLAFPQQPLPEFTTALDAVQQALGTPRQTAQELDRKALRQTWRLCHHVKLQFSQSSPHMTPSPTMLAQQIGSRPRSRKPASTAAIPSPAAPPQQSANSQASAARQPGAVTNSTQYRTSPNPMPAEPTRSQGPGSSNSHRGSSQSVYGTTHQATGSQAYPSTSNTLGTATQDNYQRYNEARTENHTSSWKPQNSGNGAHQPTAYGNKPKATKQTPPTSLSLPSYASAQADPYSKSPSTTTSAAAATRTYVSRDRNNSQPANNRWTAQQSSASQAHTSYNYGLPSNETSTAYGVDNMMPEGNSGISNTYNSNQSTYGSYGNQQMANANDNHSQQNWYGMTSGNNRTSTAYGTSSTNANSVPTYQGNTQRSSNVSGYSGHVYDQTSDQSIYDLFQNNRQH